MPESPESTPPATSTAALLDRLRDTPGLAPLVAEAEATWRARAASYGDGAGGPAWRAFEDAFPTFHEFTNRPR